MSTSSVEAVTTTSQLQARLSQPPSATTGNREQLRYLLQRGPAGGATSSPASGGPAGPASAASTLTAGAAQAVSSTTSNSSVTEAANQISLSASATNTLQTSLTSAGGVTTTKVWVPGDLLLIYSMVEAIFALMLLGAPLL